MSYRPINESLITAANYDLRQMKERRGGRGRHTGRRSFRRESANRTVLAGLKDALRKREKQKEEELQGKTGWEIK